MERRILWHLPCKVPVSASLLDTITTAFLVTDRKWSFGRVIFSQETVCPHASWDRSHYRVPPMDIRSGDLPHPLGHQNWAPIPLPSASEIWCWSITGDLFKLVHLGTYPSSGSTSGGGNWNTRFSSILLESCLSDKLEVVWNTGLPSLLSHFEVNSNLSN